MRRVVYIAAPLSAPSREAIDGNRASAERWVAYAAAWGFAPIATWITLTGQWDESRRDEGLEIDLRLIEVCDELWLCGSRVSSGMLLEAEHALEVHKPVRDFTRIDPVKVGSLTQSDLDAIRIGLATLQTMARLG